jgi:serine phosphatase RsbU (regulator of sigma subunit)
MIMKTQVKKIALLSLPVLAALAVCVVLYTKTRAVDLGAHADVVDGLRRVQQLNTTLKQQALASRFGLLNQYDSMTRTSADLRATHAELKARLAAVAYRDAAVDEALETLGAALEQQRRDGEHFKSENSVLKNSLYYLPSAADSLSQALAVSGEPPAEALLGLVNALVQNTLAYNLLKSDALRRQLDAQNAGLAESSGTISGPLQKQLNLFLKHAQMVLHQRDVLDPLMTRVLSNDVDQRVRELDGVYSRRFERAQGRVNNYRVALYGWSVALLLAVGVVAFKLRQVYANLERLVADRTEKLDAALRELWGEMQLAKKIQTALVPPRPSLSNCEVATIMMPADQVGGDYYDVLNVDGAEWVLVGDVSGHGVPAGLVMMMCQTAVHTVLESNPHIKPDRLLSIVNKALTENIRRLGEDKYMTISALCRHSDGRFYFSGLHQDIFIYRARTKTVENIESRGAWLGLFDPIDEHLSVGSFALEQGDVLLLYTDGITEAVRDGRLLDNAGLKNILSELGTESANGIVEGILQRISSYTVSDDMAAVVVKQN